MKSRTTRIRINPELIPVIVKVFIEPRLIGIHSPKIRTVKGPQPTTWRSRGIHFPWSESRALCLFNLFLTITGRNDPRAHLHPAGSLSSRPGCMREPPHLPWTVHLLKILTLSWGNSGVQRVTWYSKSQWAGGKWRARRPMVQSDLPWSRYEMMLF